MTKSFLKTQHCGCIVRAILCEINNTNSGEMYLLGGHIHVTICGKCKKDEENDIDTLHDMWINDNVTNANGYAGWSTQPFSKTD